MLLKANHPVKEGHCLSSLMLEKGEIIRGSIKPEAAENRGLQTNALTSGKNQAMQVIH